MGTQRSASDRPFGGTTSGARFDVAMKVTRGDTRVPWQPMRRRVVVEDASCGPSWTVRSRGMPGAEQVAHAERCREGRHDQNDNPGGYRARHHVCGALRKLGAISTRDEYGGNIVLPKDLGLQTASGGFAPITNKIVHAAQRGTISSVRSVIPSALPAFLAPTSRRCRSTADCGTTILS